MCPVYFLTFPSSVTAEAFAKAMGQTTTFVLLSVNIFVTSQNSKTSFVTESLWCDSLEITTCLGLLCLWILNEQDTLVGIVGAWGLSTHYRHVTIDRVCCIYEPGCRGHETVSDCHTTQLWSQSATLKKPTHTQSILPIMNTITGKLERNHSHTQSTLRSH